MDLHAGLVIPAGQRDRLERVCRYVLRPPVTSERLALTDDGQVRVALRQPWAVLVPSPRVNLALRRGSGPPRAKWGVAAAGARRARVCRRCLRVGVGGVPDRLTSLPLVP
jgi:hypothetical protein